MAEGSAWVSNAYSASVSRIDVATNRVSRIGLESAPRALQVVDGRVWVATGAFGNPEHLGGTLVVTNSPKSGVGTLDPAGVYSPNEVNLLRHVYDGLVSFRVTGGQAAQALVADLATLVPRPTDGGRTYVFTIRPGIRYSTGAEVQAGDFVLGFRRAILNELGNPAAFKNVVGAPSCIAAPELPEQCKLEGVSADDATRRLTVRLSEPDPDFLAKLALFVVPAPPGSPLKDVGMTTTIPGTGPYLVSEVRSDGLTLSRNPYFHQWSFAAQPYPYPDQIRTETTASRDEARAAVLAGRADVLLLSPQELPTLASRADQVHEFRNFNTDWAYLNARIPPFDNLKVRQALNYAVDRRMFVSLYGGGPLAATTSCQLLPAGFPGWRPHCPYQTGRPDGDYLGPDLVHAQQLVRESGTAGTPITVHAFRGYPLWDAFPAYLADVLRSIGYADVTVLDIPPEHNAGLATDPAYAGYQIFTQQGWLADYPSASTFYDLFSCHQANLSGYCNPTIEAVAVQAASAADKDPLLSLQLWAKVDRMLTDEAAFVTLGSRQGAALVSERVGNVLARPSMGPVLSQLWVR